LLFARTEIGIIHMKAFIKDRLYLQEFPLADSEAIHEHFKIPNPKYASIMKFSPTGGKYTKEPTHIYAGEITMEGTVVLPRAVEIPDNLLPEKAQGLDVTDRRVKVPVKFPKACMQMNIMQKALVASFKTKCLGEEVPSGFLLMAGTSFGKTIVFPLKIASEPATASLIMPSLPIICKVLE
jgi:hypothetical protein